MGAKVSLSVSAGVGLSTIPAVVAGRCGYSVSNSGASKRLRT